MAVVNAFNSRASVLSLNQFASSYIFRPHANAPVSSVGVGSATAKAFLSTVKEVLAYGTPQSNDQVRTCGHLRYGSLMSLMQHKPCEPHQIS